MPDNDPDGKDAYVSQSKDPRLGEGCFENALHLKIYIEDIFY